MNWNQLLSNHMSKDYTYQNEPYSIKLEIMKEYIEQADCILIGAGSGLSTAAGMSYRGKRFEENFKEFIEKYDSRYMTDMYSAGFYPFESEEEKWAYWCKYALINIDNQEPLPLYSKLLELVKDKEYFVYTTNVDDQFVKAGFDRDKIFATQGTYAYIQCAKPCHNEIYYALDLFRVMEQSTRDCRIPTYLIPKCPVCGGKMTMNLRGDSTFVEDEAWHKDLNHYIEFLKKNKHKKVLLIELGVGFNTPVIIRFPFEDMLRSHKDYRMIRLNQDYSFIPDHLNDQCIECNEDMNKIIEDLL